MDTVTATHLPSIKDEVNKQDRWLQKSRAGGRDLDLEDAWEFEILVCACRFGEER
jgi:hypothetical protein